MLMEMCSKNLRVSCTAHIIRSVLFVRKLCQLGFCISCPQVGSIDFFSDQFPYADVIMLGMILHDWGLDRKRLLIRKVGSSCQMQGCTFPRTSADTCTYTDTCFSSRSIESDSFPPHCTLQTTQEGSLRHKILGSQQLDQPVEGLDQHACTAIAA